MNEFKIRAARADESEALTALCTRSKAHWGYDTNFMAMSAASMLVRPEVIATGRVLVAEDGDGVPLGVAAVVPMEEAGSWDLDRLFIDPRAIGTGAGRALFHAVAEIAKREGAERIVILADPNAAAFYERLGAVLIGDAPSDSMPGRRLPLLRYDL